MAKVTKNKALSVIYTDLMHDKLGIKNAKLVSPTVTVGMSFNARLDAAYTHPEKDPKKFRVVIGGEMVSKVANLPDGFDSKEKFRLFFNDIIYSFYALDYHEMGHVLFTDMNDRSIVDYKEPKYIGFLHQLFNILEDPIVEISMSNLFKTKYRSEINPSEFFNFLISRLFDEQCNEYKDDGKITGFMSYLLLVLRCGKSKIKGSNAIWEKYQTDLMPMIKDILYEIDPTERIHKTITLGEWIIEHIKEFDWSELEEPEEEERLSGKGTMGGGRPSKSIISGPDEEDSFDGKFEDSSEEEPEEDEEESEDGKGSEKSEDSLEESIDDTPAIDDVFNDMFKDGDYHEWVIAKDEYEYTNKAIEAIDKQTEEFIDCVNDLTKFLNLFHGRIAPRQLSGFTRGKLNISRAIQDDMKDGCDIRIFKRKVARGKAPDLCVSLVCDNSGSMGGEKSFICSRAALALAQACEWAKIPFECNAFTKTSDTDTGTCITIKIKDFNDDFNSSKPYFCINDSQAIHYLRSEHKIPTFAGNSEEVNLFYIGQKLHRNQHTTKLMFVLCDGETTMSQADLKRVVADMEQQGIIVVAIGICDSSVKDSYSKYKIFNSIGSLKEDLAQYLIDQLSEYAI